MEINNEDVLTMVEMDAPVYFSPLGCDNCNDNKGNDVQDCACYTDEEILDHYTISLCSSCLNSYYNAEPLDKDCKNHHKI